MTNPTVDEERKPFCRAIETTSLMKELEKYRDSEEIPYDALTKAAMGNCHPGGIKHHFLKSARDILFKEQGIEKTRAILNSFKATKTNFKGAYFSKGADNPYHIDNGKGGKEDISWLL